MLIEIVLSMSTQVRHFKKVMHRAADYFQAHPPFTWRCLTCWSNGRAGMRMRMDSNPFPSPNSAYSPETSTFGYSIFGFMRLPKEKSSGCWKYSWPFHSTLPRRQKLFDLQ